MTAFGYQPRLNIHGKRIACACILLYGYHPVIWKRPINPYRNPYFQRDPRRYAKPDFLHPKTRKQWDALTYKQKTDAHWEALVKGELPREQFMLTYQLQRWCQHVAVDASSAPPFPDALVSALLAQRYATAEARAYVMVDIWFAEDLRDGKLEEYKHD